MSNALKIYAPSNLPGPQFQSAGIRHVYNYRGARPHGTPGSMILPVMYDRPPTEMPTEHFDSLPVHRTEVKDDEGSVRHVWLLDDDPGVGENAPDWQNVKPEHYAANLSGYEKDTLVAIHEGLTGDCGGAAFSQVVEVLRNRRLLSPRALHVTLKGEELVNFLKQG